MISFRPDEKIIAVYRRHLAVLILETAPIFLFLSLIVAGVFLWLALSLGEWRVLTPLVLFLSVFFLHLFWIALFIMLADFFLDVWVLTDQRIIAVEQKGLFSRTVSECALSKIQDTSVDTHGFLATILRFGNLTVRTASEHQDFIFKHMASPMVVSEEIARIAKEYANAEIIRQTGINQI